MSSTCGTCRHWIRPEDADVEPFGHAMYPKGTDLHAPYVQGMDWSAYEALPVVQAQAAHRKALEARYGECEAITITDYTYPDEPPLATTMDASRYQAVLNTQAAFGCVLHEPEETP